MNKTLSYTEDHTVSYIYHIFYHLQPQTHITHVYHFYSHDHFNDAHNNPIIQFLDFSLNFTNMVMYGVA